MRSWHFEGASLRGRLPNLKALRIEACLLTDSDATFATQFEELVLLTWHKVCSPDLPFPVPLPFPWEKTKLPKLRSLSVIPVLSDSGLMLISQQTNLEVLYIGSNYIPRRAGTVTDKGICALEILHNLRVLQVQSLNSTQRRIWMSLLSTNLVTRLEQLWLLGSNSIRTTSRYWNA